GALAEEIAVGTPRFQSRFHRRRRDRQVEKAQRSLVGFQFSRHHAPPDGPTNAIRRSIYLASGESAKRANSAAGPGYISTHPACLSELSVNPPQSTPMVATFAFPAASASWGVSPIATASAPWIFSFFRTVSKMSGAGFDSSTSSEEVFRSTRSVMRAMSRYLSTSSFLAEEATAI